MTYEKFYEKFHIQLNRQQSEAVRSIDGPILLLAVPGSGKTTVLIMRLGYMIYCAGIVPEKILTVTYTVAAAHDMKSRFCTYFGAGLDKWPEFRTINGICVKVIQYFGRMTGKAPFSLVTENEYIMKLLSDIFRKIENDYATESDLKDICRMITYIKNMMLTDDEIRLLDKEAGFKISEIYKEYRKALRSQCRMDYDDQLIYAYNILKKSPETLQYFQNKYTYICVDEAQDTSKIQHEIIKLLAGSRNNLFMVGDEDQSIYGFRAAYPEALLSFEKKYPDAKILLMEENFRSDAKIVAAADRFIQKNVLRHEKHMVSSKAAVADVERIVLKDRYAQYLYLVKALEKCEIQTAVLYRNNESMLPLVDLLERKGIPYKIRNVELTFFTHRVVQDIRNILRFAMNPKDTDLFLQIYYKLGTYMNKQDAVRICEISRQGNRDVLEAAICYDQLSNRTRKNCKLFKTHFRQLLSDQADGAINRIVSYMGYGSYIERMNLDSGKLFIFKAIAKNENSPQRLLARLDELQKILNEKPDVQQSVQPVILSTIHSSKGLEYDTVYLMDVVDGVFPENIPKNPKTMSRRERADYEEERRLFYVGVTRAKNKLSIFKLNQKSAFCEEFFPKKKAEKREAFSQEGFENFLDSLGEGLIVRHKKLGEGVIVELQDDKAVIQFDSGSKLFGLKILYEYDLLEF